MTPGAHLVSTPLSRGDQLRQARVAAGLSREDLALGLQTVPPISARSRADWIALMEIDAAEVTAEDFTVLQALIGRMAPLVRRDPETPAASAAA